MTTDLGFDTAAAATIWASGRPVYDRGENVCVIGAGASGLAAIKNLKEHGFGVDCFERETGVGGGWNWRHDRSPVYASTHLVSSKPFTEYPDFPMPDTWPDYPHHAQMLAYLERYADHFDLRRHIWFGTEVVRVEPAEGDTWDVTTRGARGGAERTQRYAAVVIANGHHWAPNTPRYEGVDGFRGQVIHSSAYKDAAQLRGRKVLVVGAGDSGCDIAVEAAQQAAACWHSTRRGYWYPPKFLRGRPADQVAHGLDRSWLPVRVRQWWTQRTLRAAVGELTRFGLPAPDHRIGETHQTRNSQLVYYVGHGAITPVRDVARFHPSTVELADGRVIDPDLVILATGYLPRFEFAAPELLGQSGGGAGPSGGGTGVDGRPGLRLRIFAPRHPTLAVAGLVQPESGLIPLAHWQTVLFARWLRLRALAPAKAAGYWREVQSAPEPRWTEVPVSTSSRHWFEVSQVRYLRALQRNLDELAVS